MCQRYVVPDQASAEREFLPAKAWWKFEPRYNVAPGQYIPAIRLHEGATEAVMLRWGLIPAWTLDRPAGRPKATVRAERVESARIYRDAWAAGQRCILPFAGFYVWQLTAGNYRQPHFASLLGRSVFGVAAVWDRWLDEEEDDVIESCALVRVAANGLLAGVCDPALGMPAILRRKDYSVWLSGGATEARAVLGSYPAGNMQLHPVSPRVNSRSADDPGLILAAPS